MPQMMTRALVVCLTVQGCGSSLGGAPRRVEPLDASISIPCPHPSTYLSDSTAEVIVGRIGDALILCGKQKAAAVAYAADLTEIINGPR